MAKRTKSKKKTARASKYSAKTADRHVLYQMAVQNPEAEIDFVDAWFKSRRKRRAVTLREDFCGTGYTACEWVKRRPANVAVGLDIDQPTLDWGLANNVSKLKPAQQSRLRLLNADVRTPPKSGKGVDVVLAMNFSYWLFKTRDAMREYFKTVRESLNADGIFFLDHYSGYESMKETRERRDIEGKFTYIWEQHRYNPITGHMDCLIHFAFKDRTRLNNAFTYSWRLWTLPELQELLTEAGFKNVTVHCEGEGDDGEGDGHFVPATECDADPAFLSYLSAEK